MKLNMFVVGMGTLEQAFFGLNVSDEISSTDICLKDSQSYYCRLN